MSQRTKQAKFWQMFAMIILEAQASGDPIVIIEWMRTKERQAYLVSIGRSKTLDSKHLEGLAGDIAFLSDINDDGIINYIPDKYKHLGEYWESLDPNNVWGGRWGDNPNTKKIEGWDSGHLQYGK